MGSKTFPFISEWHLKACGLYSGMDWRFRCPISDKRNIQGRCIGGGRIFDPTAGAVIIRWQKRSPANDKHLRPKPWTAFMGAMSRRILLTVHLTRYKHNFLTFLYILYLAPKLPTNLKYLGALLCRLPRGSWFHPTNHDNLTFIGLLHIL